MYNLAPDRLSLLILDPNACSLQQTLKSQQPGVTVFGLRPSSVQNDALWSSVAMDKNTTDPPTVTVRTRGKHYLGNCKLKASNL